MFTVATKTQVVIATVALHNISIKQFKIMTPFKDATELANNYYFADISVSTAKMKKKKKRKEKTRVLQVDEQVFLLTSLSQLKFGGGVDWERRGRKGEGEREEGRERE